MLRTLCAAALLSLVTPALAQTYGTAPPSQQPAQQAPPGQYAPPRQYAVPQPSPPQPQHSGYPQAVPVVPPGAATGGGSQQVVVNPPGAQPSAPPPPSVTVTPPPATPAPTAVNSEAGAPVIVTRESARPPLETVAIDSAYGALAGALVGTGIALIEQGNWGRDLTIGAGAGILVGAVVGGIVAVSDANRSSYAMDGLGSPDRDPPLASARTVVSYAGRF